MIVTVKYDTESKFIEVAKDGVLVENVNHLSFYPVDLESSNEYRMTLEQRMDDTANNVMVNTYTYGSLDEFLRVI